jgi:uncharacterized integral membrane protein (TIGR00698 family)
MEGTFDATQKKILIIQEDWLIVIAGFTIVGLLFLFPNIKIPEIKAFVDYSSIKENLLSKPYLSGILFQLIIAAGIFFFLLYFTGKHVPQKAIPGFIFIFFTAVIAQLLGATKMAVSLHLEPAVISLVLGLLLSNLLNLPLWIKQSISSELFVKIGLILLGSTIIISDILKAGSRGLLQSVMVVVSVWYFSFWLGRKFKLDKEMNAMLASAVSICGISAAIATAGAIRGDAKKLSYVVSVVTIVSIPMMLGMPYIAKWLGLEDAVAGAWIGGTIDTTGAVVASGLLFGEDALKIGTIVKFSQNVLLGIAALAISIYWTWQSEQANGKQTNRGSLKIIWERFPKFILGFVAMSLLFSFALHSEREAQIKPAIKSFQQLWFTLAFVSIGLETKFLDLIKLENKRPFFVFISAQFFNIIVTLLIALLVFRNFGV